MANTDYKGRDDFQELQDFQYNGVDYLYNLEPQQQNLFMVDEFYDPTEADAAMDAYDVSSKKPTNIEYRIKSISGIQLPSLNINSDNMGKALRFYNVKGNRNEKTITIDWVEDVFWTVKRYHMNWINHWYNRYLDCMVVGQRGKFRNLVMYSFHYVNVNTESATPVQKAIPIARFQFNGLVPKSVGESNFDWNSPDNEGTTKIQYVYNDVQVYFYPYTKNEKLFIGGLADFVQSAADFEKTKVQDVWNTGIVGKTNTLEGMNPQGQFGKVADAPHESVYYI